MEGRTGEATPTHLAPSLRAQRSNPDCRCGKILDCFAALAMTSHPRREKAPVGGGRFL